MNLYGLSTGLLTKLSVYSRNFNLPVADFTQQDDITRLVIIGNGTPDDCVAFILCHCLDGDTTVGILKPSNKTGISTFALLSQNITYRKQLSKVLFLLDQEKCQCQDIIKEFELQCRKQKIEILQNECREDGHLYIAECNYGRKLDIIIVINGSEKVNSDTHAIEDHLLQAGVECGIMQLPEKAFNSKDVWNSLNGKEQEAIFNRLIKSATLGKILPQQIAGLKLLK